MIPSTWQPCHRAGDGELVGYLSTDARGTSPLTVFGYPLTEPTDAAAAREVLERRGLACLAEPWWLTRPDGREFQVLITSAYPGRVDLVRADYGFASHDSERLTLTVPEAAERLRPLAEVRQV